MRLITVQSIRLALYFFLLVFLSGRIGLLLHEFAGHALFATLLGGKLTGFRLFYFGGGRVQITWPYDFSLMPMLVFDLAGIIIELIAGGALIRLAARWKARRVLGGLAAASAGVLIVHALYYLTVCTYNGSGDGWRLYMLLSASRWVVFVPAFGLTAAAAYWVASRFAPLVGSWVPGGPSPKRFATIAICAGAAALLHGSLTILEQRTVPDAEFTSLMTPASSRMKAAALLRFTAEYTLKKGRVPDPQLLSAVEARLEEKYGQAAIEPFLAMAIVAAFLAGYFKSRGKSYCPPNPVNWKDIGRVSLVSIAAILLLCALNATGTV